MTMLQTLRRASLRPALQVIAMLAGLTGLGNGPAAAQTSSTGLPGDVDVRGTAYYVYTEPGAPTVEIVIVGEGIRNGIYRLETGTTLVQALALAGGTARSDSTETAVRTSRVAVLRSVGGAQQTVYQASTEQVYLHPEQHPDLRNGDVVRASVEYEAVRKRFTFRDALDLTSRVASVIAAVLLLARR